MKTVQMTLEEDLVSAVDRAAKKLKTSRSGFTRSALRAALRQLRIEELERKQINGYCRKPSAGTEFRLWEDEQVWPE